MNRPEQDLQQLVAGYLRMSLPTNLWFHVPNSSGNRGARLGGILKSLGVRAGVPDLVFVLNDGKAAFIELKAGKGSLSTEQRVFRADCERLGVPYAVCKSLEEVQGTLQGWGLILRARAA